MSPAAAPRLVTIRGNSTELVILLPASGTPEIVHFGAPVTTTAEAVAAALARPVRINAFDQSFPGAALLPVGGLGRMGHPAVAGHRGGRCFTLAFEGVAVEEAQDRACFTAKDEAAGLTLTVDIAHVGSDVFSSRLTVVNQGADACTLDEAAAGVFLAPPGTAEAIVSSGSWGQEFQETRQALGPAGLLIENRRGRTSHDRWPSLIVGVSGFGDDHGRLLGIHLGHSGNHRLVAEPLDDGRVLVQAGELFHSGEMTLAPGETYISPTAYAAVSDTGLDGLTHRFHDAVRGLLTWPGGSMRPRPALLNTWEGNYFAHDLDRLKAQASAAAAVGIERFVLDDGWFGRRDDDTTSLGDWWVDRRKYPDGLKPLIDHVTGLGMEFGLWFEPEMVNPVSDLYRAHPDWALAVQGRPLVTGRNQLVLDIARTEVSEHLFQAIDAVLSEAPVRFIKWDMNRDLFAAGDGTGRAAYARQVRALYALMDRLRAAHPDLEIESCSSGGGRADLGVLARTHRIWTSDCTDALERIAIQRGVSRFLPPEILGSHVSASPNHQTGRRHTLAFRAIVALMGHFGVELDPTRLDETERAELAAWIATYKALRPLLHAGLTYQRGPERGRSLRTVVARDRRSAVAFVLQGTSNPGEYPGRLRIPGLDRTTLYRLTLPAPQRLLDPPRLGGRALTPPLAQILAGEIPLSGAHLADVGIALPEFKPETGAVIAFAALETHHG